MEGRQFVQGASQLVLGIGLLPVIIKNSDHHFSSTAIKSKVFAFQEIHSYTECFRITVKSKTRRIRPLFHLIWFSQSFLDSILRDILIFYALDPSEWRRWGRACPPPSLSSWPWWRPLPRVSTWRRWWGQPGVPSIVPGHAGQLPAKASRAT